MTERNFAGQGVERQAARAGRDVAVQAVDGAVQGTRQDGTARDKRWNPAPTFFHGAAAVNENLSNKF